MNYEYHYNELIRTRKEFNRKCEKTIGFEIHHIIPKCLGGTDDEYNLILLTTREHYIAHWLLWKINKNNIKIARAFSIMAKFSIKNIRTLTSIAYAACRKANIEANSGKNNSMYGIKHSNNTKIKISQKTKEATEFDACPWCGIKCNKGNAMRWHFDNCLLNPLYDASVRIGIKRSSETKNAIKNAHAQPFIFCDKCNKRGRFNSKRMNKHLNECKGI